MRWVGLGPVGFGMWCVFCTAVCLALLGSFVWLAYVLVMYFV
jgi:hypothetical protein